MLNHDENLSEVLFRPTRKSLETSFVSNSVAQLPVVPVILKIHSEHWFRLLHRVYWAWLGFDVIELSAVLAKIAASKNRRTRPEILDTVYEYGPGNWVYEFSMQGLKYAELAHKAEASDLPQEQKDHEAFKYYRLADLYYDLASYPHLRGDELGNQALVQHYLHYRKAARYTIGDFSELKFPVGKKTGTMLIHTPDKTKCLPAVIICSNYENLATEYLRFYQEHLGLNNIAMIAVDMPGIGLNANITLEMNSAVIHEAAIDYIVDKVKYIDHHRIGMLGQRIGSNCVIHCMTTHSEYIKCALIAVPILHDILSNKSSLVKTPAMIRASFANRLNFDASNWENIIPLIQVLSVRRQGILVGQKTSIPIKIISVKGDILSSEDDVKLATQVSSKSEVVKLKPAKAFDAFSEIIDLASEWFVKNLTK